MLINDNASGAGEVRSEVVTRRRVSWKKSDKGQGKRWLSGLGLASASLGRHASSSSTAAIEATATSVLVVKTGSTLVAVRSLTFVASTATTDAASIGSKVASVRIGARATLFDDDLLSTNSVRVGRDCGIVRSRVCVLDESTVLNELVNDFGEREVGGLPFDGSHQNR